MTYRYFKDLEEQILIKYYVIKLAMLQKIINMMDVNVELLQWFINFLIKTVDTSGYAIKSEIMPNEQFAEE